MRKKIMIGLPVVGLLVGVLSSRLIAQGPPAGVPSQAPVSSGWQDDGAIIRLESITDSVGIGTTTPTEKLVIVGNLSVNGLVNGIELGNLKSLAFLDAVGGGLGGAIADGTITEDDLSIVLLSKLSGGAQNSVVLRDVDGLNCHKITTNSLEITKSVAVDCATGQELPMLVVDDFENYPEGPLNNNNGGVGWLTVWNNKDFAQQPNPDWTVTSQDCFNGSRCIKKEAPDESFIRRNFRPIRRGIIHIAAKKVKPEGSGGLTQSIEFRSKDPEALFSLDFSEDGHGYLTSLFSSLPVQIISNQDNNWYEIEIEFDVLKESVRARAKSTGRSFGDWSQVLLMLNTSEVEKIRVSGGGARRTCCPGGELIITDPTDFWIDDIRIEKFE